MDKLLDDLLEKLDADGKADWVKQTRARPRAQSLCRVAESALWGLSLKWLEIYSILATGLLIALTFFLWQATRPPPPVYEDTLPEFQYFLIDNGENDFMKMRYVKAGMVPYNLPDPLPGWVLGMYGTDISIYDPEENSYFDVVSPREVTDIELPLGKAIKVPLNADVVQSGRRYWICQSFSYGVGGLPDKVVECL